MEILNIRYIDMVIFLMIINNILVYVLSRTPGFGKAERWIVRFLVAVCLCCVSDIFCISLKDIVGKTGIFILHAIFIFSLSFLSFFLFCYSETIYGSGILKKKKMMFFSHIPICILCILLIISYWTGWFFQTDTQGNYIRGPLYFMGVFVLPNTYNIVSLCLSIYRLRREKNLVQRRILWQPILYVFPFLMGICMQFFYGIMPWANMALTITILLIFINNQEKLLQRKICDAQAANQAKSEFLSRMSHDIRTPINGMMGMLDIVQINLDNPEKIDDCLSKMRVAADQLLSLINDIIDMSKIETGNMQLVEESFNLMHLLRGIIAVQKILAEEKGLEIETVVENQIKHPQVYGSSGYVRSILVNIISNAIKFTNSGGKVSVLAREISCDGRYTVFEFIVSDTGIGMSKEFLKHVFEPFTQEYENARSSYQGTGLGMSIVKNLVSEMKGTIVLDSVQSEGTTVTITLPLKMDIANMRIEEAEQEEETSIEGMRLLLVEDNDLNLEVAQYILEDVGAIITVARNGLEAVEIFKNAEKYAFDAILMDVMMPIMDGLTATKTIRGLKRKDAKTIPIIAMTANVFNEDVLAAKKAGMNEHIAKPLDFDKLIHTLAKNF